MWRNWNPLNPPINPSYSSDEANNYESAEENENDPNVLVSPNRPHQSTSASPRSLLVPDPPPVEEVLASVDQRLRTLPSRQERAGRRNAHRQAIEAAEEAAELAAAAVIIENDLVPADNMVEFDQENGVDSATALENIRSVQCPFNKEDIVFWFSQLEDQLVVIGIKKTVDKEDRPCQISAPRSAKSGQISSQTVSDCRGDGHLLPHQETARQAVRTETRGCIYDS